MSDHTVVQYKLNIDKYNELKNANELNREFNIDKPHAVTVSSEYMLESTKDGAMYIY